MWVSPAVPFALQPPQTAVFWGEQGDCTYSFEQCTGDQCSLDVRDPLSVAGRQHLLHRDLQELPCAAQQDRRHDTLQDVKAEE